ncbi:hypothetical protein HMPREF0043_00972 [Actinobaculum sp. oral taxon 183 str. F0552]|nr:hypothetical protein HMPREF0043_00972 [Actinobaculum sp. oral taxon 183 str. F0552]
MARISHACEVGECCGSQVRPAFRAVTLSARFFARIGLTDGSCGSWRSFPVRRRVKPSIAAIARAPQPQAPDPGR